MQKILVTGAAGFIGFHLCKSLIEQKQDVIGLDNLNDYYDINLKKDRLKKLGIYKNDSFKLNSEYKSQLFENFRYFHLNIDDTEGVLSLFDEEKFDIVVNLAAQAGVRYSIKNPMSYVYSNLAGFANILEGCRSIKVKHLIYASSSSVYGENEKVPFSVTDNVDNPISLYAATKKSNELMAHSYSHLYNIKTTGLRFFTVYGPWGRPDMALFLFTKAILKGTPIKVFNHGNMSRDFTYIDDIITGINIVLNNIPISNTSDTPYRIYNIGKGSPESLESFITAIENSLQKPAKKIMMPMQLGDVSKTWADIDELKALGYESKTSINEGVELFVSWYRSYYNL